MTTLTPAQMERIATMAPADAACWTAWYLERNGAEARDAEATIRAMVAAGPVEPTEARRAAGVAPAAFNATVRLLKFMGAVRVDEAGLLASTC